MVAIVPVEDDVVYDIFRLFDVGGRGVVMVMRVGVGLWGAMVEVVDATARPGWGWFAVCVNISSRRA